MKSGSNTGRNENGRRNNRKDFFGFDDENFAFVPVENLRSIERVINKLETVKKIVGN